MKERVVIEAAQVQGPFVLLPWAAMVRESWVELGLRLLEQVVSFPPSLHIFASDL